MVQQTTKSTIDSPDNIIRVKCIVEKTGANLSETHIYLVTSNSYFLTIPSPLTNNMRSKVVKKTQS